MLHKDLVKEVDEEAIIVLKRYLPKLPLYLAPLVFRKMKSTKHKYKIHFGHTPEKIFVYSPSIYKETDKSFLVEKIINTDFDIEIKRKNSYLISLLHERVEVSHRNYKKDIKEIGKLKKFYSDDAHLFAVSIELWLLSRLMKHTKYEEDREDFIRRYDARVKDWKKYNHKNHMNSPHTRIKYPL